MRDYFRLGQRFEKIITTMQETFSPEKTDRYIRGLQQLTTLPGYGIVGQLGCEVPGPSTGHGYGIGRRCEVPFPADGRELERLSRGEFETPEAAAQSLAHNIDLYRRLEAMVEEHHELKLTEDTRVTGIRKDYERMRNTFHLTCYANTTLERNLQRLSPQYPELAVLLPPEMAEASQLKP